MDTSRPRNALTDSLGDSLLSEDDYYDQDQPRRPPLAKRWSDRFSFAFVLCFFAILMTVEYMIRTANSAYYMHNYRVFLNFILIVGCATAFFMIILYKRYVNNSLDTLINRDHLPWFLFVSVFDTVGMYMIILSAAYISAPLAALLAQGVIPVSMLMSKWILHRSFTWVHYSGSAVIIGAIAVQMFSLAYEPVSDSSSFGWGVVFFFSNLPIAFGMVLKDVLLRGADGSAAMPSCIRRCLKKRRHVSSSRMFATEQPYDMKLSDSDSSLSRDAWVNEPADMHSLNAWVAFFQVFMSLILSPVAYAAQGGTDVSTDPQGIFENFGDGFSCWISEHNSLEGDNCHSDPGAFLMVLLHVFVLVVLNITALIIVLRGSAVIFFLASAASIPLTMLAALPTVMQDVFHLAVATLQWYDFVSSAGVLIGMWLYHSHPEAQEQMSPNNAP